MLDKWTGRFLSQALLVASWSKDPSTQVGAVIVDRFNRVVGQGFNGLPTGWEDKNERLQNREIKYPFVIHAEKNAIYFSNSSVRNCTLYCSTPPCAECASAIQQNSIARIICLEPSVDYLNRWQKRYNLMREFVHDVDIIYKEVCISDYVEWAKINLTHIFGEKQEKV